MAGRRDGGQHRSSGPADRRKASDTHRELAHAAAVELPQADARTKHGLLSGRVRGSHHGQGDANLTCSARNHFRAGRRHGRYEYLRDVHDHPGWRT
ncbi:hypothetical protein D3C76_1230160 [compost metagenome]